MKYVEFAIVGPQPKSKGAITEVKLVKLAIGYTPADLVEQVRKLLKATRTYSDIHESWRDDELYQQRLAELRDELAAVEEMIK